MARVAAIAWLAVILVGCNAERNARAFDLECTEKGGHTYSVTPSTYLNDNLCLTEDGRVLEIYGPK